MNPTVRTANRRATALFWTGFALVFGAALLSAVGIDHFVGPAFSVGAVLWLMAGRNRGWAQGYEARCQDEAEDRRVA